MKSRRFAIVAVTALSAVGAGAAIAANQDSGANVETAILSDAADRLDVGAGELRSALSEAQQAQIDKAVEDGRLTEGQANEIKRHMQESGHVLGFPGGPGGPHGGPGGPGGPAVFDAIANELGISEQKLHEQLESGRSMRQVAGANGKTVADVKSAAKAAIEKQLADDVDSDRISQEQADAIRDDLPEILRHIVRGPRFHGGPPPMGPPPMGPPPREFRR